LCRRDFGLKSMLGKITRFSSSCATGRMKSTTISAITPNSCHFAKLCAGQPASAKVGSRQRLVTKLVATTALSSTNAFPSCSRILRSPAAMAGAPACCGRLALFSMIGSYAITYRSASNHKKLASLGSMASRPLAMRLRSSLVRNIENSEEECSECGLNADHHSGEAKHENSRYEWVEQIAKI